MNTGQIISFGINLIAGLYVTGLGFKFLPDPGKKSSKIYLDKYRILLKIGGLATIFAALLKLAA